MDFVVQFVGIVLFITLSAGSGDVVAYNVVMPNEDNVCGITDMKTKHDHKVFIRVEKLLVDQDADWQTAPVDCLNGQTCKLYPLEDSVIEISNTVNTGPVAGTLTALHLQTDYNPTSKLKKGLEDSDMTNAQMWVNTGTLVGKTLTNKMIATNWKLQSAASKKITITAKPRHGGKNSVLVLDLTKAPPVVQIVNTTKEMAQEKLGEVMGNDDPHFFIYYRMTDPEPTTQDKCKKPPAFAFGPLRTATRLASLNTPMLMPQQNDDDDGGASIACSNTQWP